MIASRFDCSFRAFFGCETRKIAAVQNLSLEKRRDTKNKVSVASWNTNNIIRWVSVQMCLLEMNAIAKFSVYSQFQYFRVVRRTVLQNGSQNWCDS